MAAGGLDELDFAVIEALDLDGRVPLRQVAGVLGVSDQTVARRYRRLRTVAGLRVVAELDSVRVGQSAWLVRVGCTPDAALPVAEALAQRDDTAWVSLTSGGTEIVCVLRSGTDEARDELLLQKLPQTRRIVSVTAHQALHVYMASRNPWVRRFGTLRPEQAAVLAHGGGASPGPGVRHSGRTVRLDELDRALTAVLARDGRAGYPELAAAARCSETTARRRLDELRRGGIIDFEVELDARAVGLNTTAMLWLSVAPAELAAVGEAMAAHPEVPFVAATTGPTNLVASVLCTDAEDLYGYLSRRVGSLPGVRHVETAPRIRTVKQEGTLRSPVGRTRAG